MKRDHRCRSTRLVAALVLALALGACRLARTAAEAPGKLASAALGNEEEPRPTPWDMTLWLMGFADTVSGELEGSTREFAELVGTDEARIQALEWRLEYTTIALHHASYPQPYDGFFGVLLALAVLRGNHEATWLAEFGEAGWPLSDTLTRLEKLAWDKAARVLGKDELTEIHRIIEEWLRDHPDAHATTLPEFEDLYGKAATDGESTMGVITDLLTLDPLAGLEPAAREVELTRQFAERGFFYLQRVPRLLEMQGELLTLRLARTPEVRSVLADSERISRAAESLAATAQTLPGALSEELDAASEPAQELLGSARTTLEAARETSVALTETLRALDAFVGRFDKPEEPAAPVEPPASEQPAEKGFDIADYGVAAEKIGVAARELTAAITALDGSLPALEETLSSATREAQHTVDHLYRRAIQLLVLALAGGLLVWLAAGWISGRRRTLPR